MKQDPNLDRHFEDDLSLDEAWKKHPRLVRTYGQQLSDAVKRQEELEYDLKLLEAELDAKVRTNPEKYSIEKVTEGAISKKITTHPKHVKLSRELIEANHNVSSLQKLLVALEHKKAALSSLSSLWIAQYYAEPKVNASKEDASEFRRKVSQPLGIKSKKGVE